MSIGKHLGKVKIWQQRLATYVSMINFAMIFYLYIIESPMGFQWYHWLIMIFAGVILVVFVDTMYIMPHAYSYTFEKNSEFQEVKMDVKAINKKLDEIAYKIR